MAQDTEMEDELIVEDPSLRQGWFVPLPEVVLFALNLSAEAKVLYAVILTFARGKTNAFPGQERLGGLTGGKDVRTVRRWLHELQKARLLRVERRGLRKTNRYHLLVVSQADLPQSAVVNREESSDRTKMSGLDGTNLSALDRTEMSAEIRSSSKEIKREITTTGSPPTGAVVVSRSPTPEEIETIRRKYTLTTGRELRPTLAKRWLKRFELKSVLKQIALLGESLDGGHAIPNPEGWLTEALKEEWRSTAEAAREAFEKDKAAKAAARAEREKMSRESWERHGDLTRRPQRPGPG